MPLSGGVNGPRKLRKRSYAPFLLAIAAAAGLFAAGVFCLQTSGAISISAGYAPVAELEAYGDWPDPEDLHRAWRTARWFGWAGWFLIVASVLLPVGGTIREVRMRRARRSG